MFFFGLIKGIIERQEHSRTAEVEFLRTRVVELERDLLEMKREGFQRPPVMQQFQYELLPDEIMVAIDGAAPEGSTLYNDLLDHARTLQVTGMPADLIADRITQGGSFEDFD